eukprot:2254380-Rhodomonas_salina.2
MSEVLTITAKALSNFHLKTLSAEGYLKDSGNFRPLQPRGGRTVYMTAGVTTAECKAHEAEAFECSAGEEDEGECLFPGRAEAARNGLHHLMLSFFDSVQAVLDKYAPGASHQYDHAQRDRNDDRFAHLHPSAEREAAMRSDPDMQFLLENLEGDLFEGLNYVQDIFHEEVHLMLHKAHVENEILFVMYALTLISMWYIVLFRSVVFGAYAEVEKAKDFVSRMPLQVMTNKEITAITSMFQSSDDHDNPNEDAREREEDPQHNASQLPPIAPAQA